MQNRWKVLALLLVLTQWPDSASAAEADLSAQMNLMQTQLEQLSQRVENQQKIIEEQKKKMDAKPIVLTGTSSKTPTVNSLEAILDRLDKTETLSAEAIQIASRKKPNDLNMAIGAAIDTAYRSYSGPSTHTDGPAGNDFGIRGAELVFSADVDPFFKTYMVLNAVPDPKNNGEAMPTLEEAALMTTSLSYAQVKGGRFFMPFGRLSMTHDHDLPFTTRPASIDHYVGGESQGDGVQVQALLPIDHFLQFTGGVFNKLGANFPMDVGQQRGASELTYFAKALTSFDLGESHTFDWGVSTAQVPNQEIRRSLFDMEITYRWHPTNTNLREKLIWGTEILHNELRSLKEIPAAVAGDPSTFQHEGKQGWGGYSYVEYFLTQHWSLGPRVDFFQNTDPNVAEKRNFEQTYSAFVSYKFGEFSRLRFEYNRHEFSDGKSANEGYLQWTVFWGAHSHNFDGR